MLSYICNVKIVLNLKAITFIFHLKSSKYMADLCLIAVFSGELCAQEATDCGCVHGTCSDDPHTTCNCDLGWKGFDCSVKITTCDDNPCQNGT